jgi:hypothetical protein
MAPDVCYLYYGICSNYGDYYVDPPDTSIFSEWFDNRRWEALYCAIKRQAVSRWIWLVQRSEPRWRAGRWKAKT